MNQDINGVTNPILGGLLGLAVGDAFGVPVEFMTCDEVQAVGLENMEGSDTRLGSRLGSRWGNLIPAGAWSDDTSMTVAAMASIVDNGGGIDYEDIMRRFRSWWETGQYSALGTSFGLGGCVSKALRRFADGVPALKCGGTGVRENGNGALMRIFPFSILCIERALSEEETCEIIKNAAGITHGHEISKMSCFIYTQFLRECLKTGDPIAAYKTICRGGKENFTRFYGRFFSDEAIRAHEGILSIAPDDIEENGYVVNSLKVALYSMVHTGSYEAAVKMAVHFGYDTDTNGAITGSIAGALYGAEDIPQRWLDALIKRKYLEQLAGRFATCISEKGNVSMDNKKTERTTQNHPSKKRTKKGTGFAAPAYGTVIPDDVIRKVGEDGLIRYYKPDGTEWRP